MPGVQPRNLRLGNRSELLVEHLLAGLAFTTRVPRPEDFGIDFFCSLISAGPRQLLKAGPSFTVQAKSSNDPVIYEKDYEVEWITNQENPLLLCVADRAELAMDVYSTWNLVCAVNGGWRGVKQANRITLLPGTDFGGEWPGIVNRDDGSQEIRLGKVRSDDIFNDGRMEQISTVLREWLALDRTNIVNRYTGQYWVLGPLQYETGLPPLACGQGRVVFYWHPNNRAQCAVNLGKASTALALIFRKNLAEGERTKPIWSQRIAALDEVVKSHWDLFDDPVRQFLTEQGIHP